MELNVLNHVPDGLPSIITVAVEYADESLRSFHASYIGVDLTDDLHVYIVQIPVIIDITRIDVNTMPDRSKLVIQPTQPVKQE